MSSVILAYSDKFIGFDVNYNASFSTVLPSESVGEQMTFDALKFIDNISTTAISGKLLNNRNYEHQKGFDELYQIVISANELLTPAKLEFIKNFWIASHKYLCLNELSKYKLVVTGGGNFPKELLEESKYLIEVNMELKVV